MFSSNNSQVSNDAVFVEDIFSTYLYTGNGSTQTITNNIDLSTKGGMVWIKSRSNAKSNSFFDTDRGAYQWLTSNGQNGSTNFSPNSLTSFNSNGFSLLDDATSTYAVNGTGYTYASWTFRKQPKFFDVVTYTGDGTSNKAVSHSLGSVPGCILVKKTSAAGTSWTVYHRSLGYTQYLVLNSTQAASGGSGYWYATPTSTQFYVGDAYSDGWVNASGATYVAYLFAHDAGGFGLTGTDNVISCGSYTGNGGTPGPVITLGYEPQYLLIKRATGGAGEWKIIDAMRGLVMSPSLSASLNADTTDVEGEISVSPSSTGFSPRGGASTINLSGNTYIYIAIRRGPMKVPTSGTSVFTSVTKTGVTSVGQTNTTNFPVDLSIDEGRATNYGALFNDRLRGSGPYLNSSSTAAEANQSPTYYVGFDSNTSVFNKNYGALGGTYVNWLFRRAPSFFDEVCYTGTRTTQTITHNLTVAPEMIIAKCRSAAGWDWAVYHKSLASNQSLRLNYDWAAQNDGVWTTTAPTASVFYLASTNDANYDIGATDVAYLFATCAGVSKVGSYTGNGSTQTINCGFTGGARFVMIKRTDDVGDWYVYDTARGMTTSTDPYLLLNSTAAESTSLGSVTTSSTGFDLNAGILTAINTNGASYIFLAIA